MRRSAIAAFINLMIALILINVSGCAGIDPPTPEKILKHPLGSMLRVGLTKDKITAQWGEPDLKEYDDTGKWGNSKERWTYYARYDGFPVDAGYLSNTQYLYFDGNYLVKFSEGE